MKTDNQQAAREFEEWYDAKWWENHRGAEPYFYPFKEDALLIWQASREALMPALEEARDELVIARMAPYYQVFKRIDQALARLNTIIGEK